MALHNLGNLLELACHVAVHRAFLELHAYVGAGVVAEGLGVDVISGAYYDFHVYESLDALMDGGSGDAADNGDVF